MTDNVKFLAEEIERTRRLLHRAQNRRALLAAIRRLDALMVACHSATFSPPKPEPKSVYALFVSLGWARE